MPIPVKIRSNNHGETDAGNDTGSNEYETMHPPLPRRKKRAYGWREERKGERGEYAMKTRHCAGYLERRVLTIVHNYERGAVPNKKHYIRWKYNTVGGGRRDGMDDTKDISRVLFFFYSCFVVYSSLLVFCAITVLIFVAEIYSWSFDCDKKCCSWKVGK